MSDQSPWGSPPPSGGPFGSPGQPPPQPGSPPQSSYPQPGGAYGGGPPSYGAPPPQEPQRPKRPTGLILGIVAAVLLVVAAFGVTLVVAGDKGGDPQKASTDGPTGDPTSDPTTDPTTDPSTDPTTDPVTPGPGGDPITGDGYTYDLPNVGWTDATAEAGSLGGAATIDTVIVLGSSIKFSQSNIIVEALSDGGASSVEDLEGLWKRNLGGADGATPTDIDEIQIAGERAIGVRIDDRANANGDPITQIAYLALHDGQQYSIGLSFPASGDTVSEGDFEKVLASWTWS